MSLGDGEGMQPPVQQNTIEIPYLKQWQAENVRPFYLDENYCLIREVAYPLSQRHGLYCFKDFISAVKMWNSSTAHHPLSATGHKPEDLFFFDTETTGLGGGAGNTIFLLGYASVSGDQLVLRQHILPNPGAEVPLYQSFLERVNYTTLVTYNGKAFDWPQVKTRHTLVRDHVPKLPQFGHFDLYHAARRLWKHKLDRLKLSVVEQEVLGIERFDDIPGYLAPMIYFDYVETKRPDGMIGILKHNEVDILSLVTLYTHLTFLLCGKEHSQSRRESYEVARWFDYVGEKTEAKKLFSDLAGGDDLTSLHAKQALAFQAKKQHQWEQALELFQQVADGNGDDEKLTAEACVETAKIFEHKQKKLAAAIDYSLKALKLVQQLEASDWRTKAVLELEKRLERLERKYSKFPG